MKNLYTHTALAAVVILLFGFRTECRADSIQDMTVAAVPDTVVVVHRDTVYFIGGKQVTGRREFLAAQGPVPARGGSASRKTALPEQVARMAVRTNLFAPLLNAGVEVPLDNMVSVALDVYWPFVPRPLVDRITGYAGKACFQGMAFFAEGRYWFGENHGARSDARYRLTGHSLALVAGGGYYDVEREWKGEQGELAAVGVDYMYCVPFGRGRVRMEFNLCLGAAFGKAKPYEVHTEGGNLIHRKGVVTDVRWFGPIRGGVSLMFPITWDSRKGGAR